MQNHLSIEPLPEKEALIPPLPSVHQAPTIGPYLELIRIAKPAGTLYLFIPALSTTLIAASLLEFMPSPDEVSKTVLLFLAGSTVFRGAACTWNDILDQDIDRRVTRTRNRPLARNAISTSKALVFTCAQALVGLYLLSLFPIQCIYYSVPPVILIALYPLGKRCTNYPQVILSFTWAYGFVIGFPAVGINPLKDERILPVVACLYGSGMAWTIMYDTVYAHQDIQDDKREGVRSIAIQFESYTKPFLSSLCFLQVSFLGLAGSLMSAGIFYYAGCLGAALSGIIMVATVDLEDPSSCAWWFHRGAWLFTGCSIALGCFGQYFARLRSLA